MKTLSAAFLAEIDATVKRPLWLVQIDFAPAVRLCSWGDVSWAGEDWTGADLRVSGLESGPAGEQAGTLELGNADLAWSALVLAEGVADRPIRVWQSYLGALEGDDSAAVAITARGGLLIGYVESGAAGVLLPVFSGVGDDADIRAERVRISLASASSRHLKSPRETGGDFTIVQPVGTRISFGGETYTLERET